MNNQEIDAKASEYFIGTLKLNDEFAEVIDSDEFEVTVNTNLFSITFGLNEDYSTSYAQIENVNGTKVMIYFRETDTEVEKCMLTLNILYTLFAFLVRKKGI